MMPKQVQEQDNELKKQLIEYEKMYKELNIKLHKSQSHVIENERELLACLQKLMPLQNTYLKNIIADLQDQVKQNQPSNASDKTILEQLDIMMQETPSKQTTSVKSTTRTNNLSTIF